MQHCNLGMLSSLRIGHVMDKPPKWYLENVSIITYNSPAVLKKGTERSNTI